MNIQLKKEREEFRNKLKNYVKLNIIKYKDIANHVGITQQELHNMLLGFQETVNNKSMDFKTMWEKIEEYTGEL